MAESTLALKVQDIQAKLGTFAGWGRGAIFGDPAWSDSQQAILDDATASGLRRFYFPEPLEGEATSHDWSFLVPTSSVVLAEGQGAVQLPDNYGGFDGMLTLLTTSQTTQRWRIEWRNEGFIRERYSVLPQQTGPPMFACPRPVKAPDLASGQRFELFVFPLADQDYTIQFQYFINPDCLNGSYPYAFGGAQHTETILESCLAIMEERLDDASAVHRMAFLTRLAASVAIDRRNKPQKIGKDRDRSDDWGSLRQENHWNPSVASYNGQSFD